MEATRALPAEVEELLNVALVAEFTVINPQGRPVTYPLIPLYDGKLIYMTSSVLFSKKLEHIKANPRVSLTITDPVAAAVEDFRRVTIQGDARVIEDDLHSGWEGHIGDLWIAKEPIVKELIKKRFAMPLFWERSIIEVTPRRGLIWSNGNTAEPPQTFSLEVAA